MGEEFARNHGSLSDDMLISEIPEPFTPLKLFTSTYEATLVNINLGAKELLDIIEPDGEVKVINCNFGHKALPGWEEYIKHPKEPKDATKTRRKKQGDGTSFNSAIEPLVKIDHPDIPPEKFYKVKCFPTTGETQVPGVLAEDASDGVLVIASWAKFLNDSGVGGLDLLEPIAPVDGHVILRNFKFALRRTSPRMIINRVAVTSYLSLAEPIRLVCAYDIGEVKCTHEASRISFVCTDMEGVGIKVKMFLRGKVNILGGKTIEHGRVIWKYLSDIFAANWRRFILLEPKPDKDLAKKPGEDTSPTGSAPPRGGGS